VRAPCGDVTQGGRIPAMPLRQYAGRHDRLASESAKTEVSCSMSAGGGCSQPARSVPQDGAAEAIFEITGTCAIDDRSGTERPRRRAAAERPVRCKGGARRHISSDTDRGVCAASSSRPRSAIQCARCCEFRKPRQGGHRVAGRRATRLARAA
jgi:hypothetical protein